MNNQSVTHFFCTFYSRTVQAESAKLFRTSKMAEEAEPWFLLQEKGGNNGEKGQCNKGVFS